MVRDLLPGKMKAIEADTAEHYHRQRGEVPS